MHQIHLPCSGKIISKRKVDGGKSITDPNCGLHHVSLCKLIRTVFVLHQEKFISSFYCSHWIFLNHQRKSVKGKDMLLVHTAMGEVFCLLCWQIDFPGLRCRTKGSMTTTTHTLLSPVTSADPYSPPEHMGCVKCQIKADGHTITLRMLIRSPYRTAKFTSTGLEWTLIVFADQKLHKSLLILHCFLDSVFCSFCFDVAVPIICANVAHYLYLFKCGPV